MLILVGTPRHDPALRSPEGGARSDDRSSGVQVNRAALHSAMAPGPHGQVPSSAPDAPIWSSSVYVEAKHIARLLLSNRRPGDSISPTIMVHEAFVRLERSGIQTLPPGGQGRRPAFFALVRLAMRSVMVDWIRRRTSPTRPGAAPGGPLDHHARSERDTGPAPAWLGGGAELARLHGESLAAAMRQLEQIDARKALVAEFRCLRGMSTPQIAAALGVCERTVELDWAGAKVWLKRQITSAPGPG